jgi:hypothetical protein
MKKVMLFIMTLIAAQCLRAQINVGSVEEVTLRAGNFKPKELEALKKTTTIFIIRNSDEDELEYYQSLLDSVWDITKIKVIRESDWKLYKQKPQYSFFTIGGFVVTKEMRTGSASSSHLYLHLWMHNPESDNILTFSRIELFPDFKTMSDMGSLNLYHKGNIRNWGFRMIANNLQLVNQLLKKGETRWLFKEGEVPDELKHLKTQTLYVPDYVLIKANASTGDESERHDPKKLFQDYEFKYEILSLAQLNEKILTSENPIYYLTYVKSSTDKFINIQNSKTGKIIYSQYTSVSYNIKASDFKKISKAIAKIFKK